MRSPSRLKGKKRHERCRQFMSWYLVYRIPDTGPGPDDGAGVAPDDSPALGLERVGLSPVQQCVDDPLSLPLDSVVQTVPAAVVLHGGVTARPDESAGDVVVAVLAGHQEGSPVVLVHQVHNTLRVAQQQVDKVQPLVRHRLEQSILTVLALVVDIDLGMLDELPRRGHVPVPDSEGEGCSAVVG